MNFRNEEKTLNSPKLGRSRGYHEIFWSGRPAWPRVIASVVRHRKASNLARVTKIQFKKIGKIVRNLTESLGFLANSLKIEEMDFWGRKMKILKIPLSGKKNCRNSEIGETCELSQWQVGGRRTGSVPATSRWTYRQPARGGVDINGLGTFTWRRPMGHLQAHSTMFHCRRAAE